MKALEALFAQSMLLATVRMTQADHPFIRRLKCHSAIRAVADVSTFYGKLVAARYATLMAPHPSPVCPTLA